MMRAPKRNRPRRGMTLIEVLAAMAVFLIALAGISQLVDYGSDLAIEASRTNTGTRLAQSKMAEVEAGIIPVESGGTGTFDVEQGWEWEATSQPTDAPYVYAVTVTCKSTVGRVVTVKLEQMIFDPQYMGNASEAQPPSTTGVSR
jgi:general secretion pathway protein I